MGHYTLDSVVCLLSAVSDADVLSANLPDSAVSACRRDSAASNAAASLVTGLVVDGTGHLRCPGSVDACC